MSFMIWTISLQCGVDLGSLDVRENVTFNDSCDIGKLALWL